MQLHIARLCLDCEEIYDQQSCPVCSSESFAYLSRWIPVPERRTRPRPPESRESRETADTYRQLLDPKRPKSRVRRLVKGGVLGLAAVGIGGWILRQKPAARRQSIEPDEQSTPGSSRSDGD